MSEALHDRVVLRWSTMNVSRCSTLGRKRATNSRISFGIFGAATPRPLYDQEHPVTISGQPVISRETRRLLITVVAAVATLWVLARIRFQERPVTSTPVPNVLAQLRPSSSYADLARLIADIRPTIVASVSGRLAAVPRFAFVKTPRSR